MRVTVKKINAPKWVCREVGSKLKLRTIFFLNALYSLISFEAYLKTLLFPLFASKALSSWPLEIILLRGSVLNRTSAWSPSQMVLQLKSSLSFIFWMQSLPSGVHLMYSFGSLPTDACNSAGTHLHFSRILLLFHSWNNSTLQPLCLRGMLRKALVHVILFTAVI